MRRVQGAKYRNPHDFMFARQQQPENDEGCLSALRLLQGDDDDCCKEQCADESTVQIIKCNNINCNYRRFGTFNSEKSWGPSYNKCQKHGYL
ncbi:hypothetical protein PgNI_10387 [Pyricularia grisea]|uniref:Uncharacterized protein n=1 Tax=Pyricularia grisea TaxID=148305 RepID=A0A6P8AYK6_PYRGI|nr:hypothetical protein PgNI_10387 [Pyricularia grisea]TLD07427.1 hypothetical protein PgNI_10387 [Pyricularia grisea]